MFQGVTQLFRENTTLEELVISQCALTTAKFSKFCIELTHIASLKSLELSKNRLESDCGPLLARLILTNSGRRNEEFWSKGLRNQPVTMESCHEGLCDIDLTDNLLDDSVAFDLEKALVEDLSLRSLSLKSNRIGNEGCARLAQILTQNQTLLNLDLRDNPGLDRKNSQLVLERLMSNMKLFQQRSTSSFVPLAHPPSPRSSRAKPNQLAVSTEQSQREKQPSFGKKQAKNSLALVPDNLQQEIAGLGDSERVGPAAENRSTVTSLSKSQLRISKVTLKATAPTKERKSVEKAEPTHRKNGHQEDSSSPAVESHQHGVESYPLTAAVKCPASQSKESMHLFGKLGSSNGVSNEQSELGIRTRKKQKGPNKTHDSQCLGCRELQKALFKAESKVVNLSIENSKLRQALQGSGYKIDDSCSGDSYIGLAFKDNKLEGNEGATPNLRLQLNLECLKPRPNLFPSPVDQNSPIQKLDLLTQKSKFGLRQHGLQLEAAEGLSGSEAFPRDCGAAAESDNKPGSFEKDFCGLIEAGFSPTRVGEGRLLDLHEGSLGRDDRTMALPHNLTDSGSGLYNNTVNLEQNGYGAADSGLGHDNPAATLGNLNNRSGYIEPSRIDGPPAMGLEYFDENDQTADMNFVGREEGVLSQLDAKFAEFGCGQRTLRNN